MLTRDRQEINRSARTAADRGLKSAAKPSRAGARWSRVGERKVTRPTIDQDRLTIVLLLIIMVLTALNFMLRFPALGAVVASYNQF